MPELQVTVATFDDSVRAEAVQSFLASEGIPSTITEDSDTELDGEIKLQVSLAHVDRAELLLSQVLYEKDDDEPAPAGTPSIRQDAQADRRINQLVDRLFKATIVAWIIWPVHFYAFMLLLQFAGSDGQVSADRRWKVWASVVLSLPLLVAALILLAVLTQSGP